MALSNAQLAILKTTIENAEAPNRLYDIVQINYLEEGSVSGNELTIITEGPDASRDNAWTRYTHSFTPAGDSTLIYVAEVNPLSR